MCLNIKGTQVIIVVCRVFGTGFLRTTGLDPRSSMLSSLAGVGEPGLAGLLTGRGEAVGLWRMEARSTTSVFTWKLWRVSARKLKKTQTLFLNPLKAQVLCYFVVLGLKVSS